MDFRPMADRVLVRRSDPETKTLSGLVIPDSTAEKANQGTVVAVGPGRSTVDGRVIPIADVAIGDLVMFGPDAGIPVKVNSEALLVLKESELIAVVDQ